MDKNEEKKGSWLGGGGGGGWGLGWRVSKSDRGKYLNQLKFLSFNCGQIFRLSLYMLKKVKIISQYISSNLLLIFDSKLF